MYWDFRHTALLVIGLAALALGLAPSCERERLPPARCGHMAFIKGSGWSEASTRPCPGRWVAVPTGPWYRCECPAPAKD